MKLNFKRRLGSDLMFKCPGYGEGYVLRRNVVKKTMLKNGNVLVQDNTGRVYNVHPVQFRVWNDVLRKDIPVIPLYPVRWQLMSWDVSPELEQLFLEE